MIVSYLAPILHRTETGRFHASVAHASGGHASTLLSIKDIPSFAVALRVRVLSRDQGWADYPKAPAGSWSWGEIRLQKKLSSQPEQLTQRSLAKHRRTWTCYHNKLADFRYHLYDVTFPNHHELWSNVEQGDELTFVACAELPGWQNQIRIVELSLYTAYEPNLSWIEAEVSFVCGDARDGQPLA